MKIKITIDFRKPRSKAEHILYLSCSDKKHLRIDSTDTAILAFHYVVFIVILLLVNTFSQVLRTI